MFRSFSLAGRGMGRSITAACTKRSISTTQILHRGKNEGSPLAIPSTGTNANGEKPVFNALDVLGDVPSPVNNVDSVLEDGFVFTNGLKLRNNEKGKTKGVVLMTGEVVEWNLEGALEGLDTGIVEITPDCFGIFDVSYPKPELLIIGLGKKSRMLGAKTRKLLTEYGMQLEVSDTINAARNFDLLATERPSQVAAVMLPPNI